MGTPSQFIDITGKTFNELTAIRLVDSKNHIWEWECSCGKICNARKNDVVLGKKKSCGHLSNRGGAQVNVGDKFWEWTVLEDIGNRKLLCRCSCGVIKTVASYDLRKGKSKSCGHVTKGTSDNGRKDLTGQQIGEWHIGEYIGNGLYTCTCSCGTVKNLMGTYLRTGQSKSCGCKSNKFQELTGMKFGEWEVLSFAGDYKWNCRCSCGEVRQVLKTDLVRGTSTNCGHNRTPQLLGKKYGMLTPIEYLGNNCWRCKCDCGNTTKVLTSNIINNSTKSCGCLKDLKKSQILESIKQSLRDYINSNGQLPFSEDIANILNITPTTVRKYSEQYDLTEYFNKHFGSRAERDIYNICKQYDDNIILHDRTIIAPLELDIYIPSKKLAIEFNGDYWHSSDKVSKKYHQQKTIDCAKKGIQLIHIFEYEWNDIEKQIKISELIKSKLKSPDNKIYARNTELKLVSDEDAEIFLNIYHLQGYTQAKINLGLYHDKELISLITFGSPRFNNNYQYEIIRYCTKHNYSIVGGAEKLFKYFKDKYKPQSIITYSDISKFTGNVYTRIGFKPIQPNPITEPNYIWINEVSGDIMHRYQTQKHKLIELGLGKEEQTESEIMMSNGYMQVFDCGNIKLEYIA